MVGDNEVYHEVGTTYYDAGASAVDNSNEAIQVTVTNNVDDNNTGLYRVLYDAKDSSENMAQQKQRLVHVVDTLPPVITLNGDTTVYHEVAQVVNEDTQYTDAGATVSDNQTYTDADGNVVNAVELQTQINVDITKKGTYSVVFTATDLKGNKSEKRRIVHVTDTVPPTITVNYVGDTILHEVNTNFMVPTATATDNSGEPVEVKVNSNVDITTLGTYSITYDAVDASGNTADTKSLTVEIQDTTKPVIHLIGLSEMWHEVNTPFSDPGFYAEDNSGKNITVVAGGEVDVSVLGAYTLTYDANDDFNDAIQVTRIVNVRDTVSPVITMVGDNEVYHEVGTTYYDAGASAVDNSNEAIQVTVTNNVDDNNTGLYRVLYDAKDSSENMAQQKQRLVHVVDTLPPVITLNGDATVYHEVAQVVNEDTQYTDAGATVSDNQTYTDADGNVVNAVELQTQNNVDITNKGTYSVVFTATDLKGNKSEKRRIVHVTDTVPPTITVNYVGDTILHEVNTNFMVPTATASDNSGEPVEVKVNSNVDITTLGTYTITYNAVDASGNTADTKSLTVEIQDTTKPVIHLIGLSEMWHEVNTPFSDPGFYAEDNSGKNITVVAGDSRCKCIGGIYFNL